MAPPLSLLAVPSSSGVVRFWHVGIVWIDGLHVVSKRPGRGVVVESIQGFLGDALSYENFMLCPEVGWDQVIANVRSCVDDRGYSWTTDNCEHLVMRVLGLREFSPQVEAGVGSGSTAGLVGVGVTALAQVKNPWFLLLAAGVSAIAIGGSRATSLYALYQSQGLAVQPVQAVA